MVSAPPKRANPPSQQSLLPELPGDPRILVPGYAGQLAADEFAYVQDQLARDKRLARLWGFRPSARRRPEMAIRVLAQDGDPLSSRNNSKLARRPSPVLALFRAEERFSRTN